MKKKNGGFWLAFPAIAGFTVFYFVPFLITVWYSVSFGIGKREFVGMANFIDLFHNEMFLLSLKNTGRFLVVSVPVILAGSLLLSMLLQKLTRGLKGFRLAYFYPMMIPIASTVLGVQLFFGETGIINRLLLLVGENDKDWLHSSLAFWVICILYWWKYTGYHVLILFARLQMIPKPYYENARLDGAGNGTIFRCITLPLIAPVLLFNLVLALMNAFKCYREAFLLGGNYPNDSIYLLQHFMNNNFQNLNYQKISSASVVLLTVILVFCGIGYGIYRVIRGRAYE